MKFITFLIISILLSGCDFVKAFSSSFAKEYCSCRFVEGQSKQNCKDYAYNFIPPWSIVEDEKKKQVTVSSLFKSTTAVYSNKRYGCSITI